MRSLSKAFAHHHVFSQFSLNFKLQGDLFICFCFLWDPHIYYWFLSSDSGRVKLSTEIRDLSMGEDWYHEVEDGWAKWLVGVGSAAQHWIPQELLVVLDAVCEFTLAKN